MILEKQKSVFHERNIYRIKLLDLAMESSLNLERWNTALEYGLLLVSSFRYVLTLK